MTNKDLTQEEKEALRQVVRQESKERERETFAEATVNRLKETAKVGNTGYKREIVISIPQEMTTDMEEDLRLYIQRMGEIARDDSFGLPVTVEKKSIQGVPLMNFIMKYTPETDLDAIEQYLL